MFQYRYSVQLQTDKRCHRALTPIIPLSMKSVDHIKNWQNSGQCALPTSSVLRIHGLFLLDQLILPAKCFFCHLMLRWHRCNWNELKWTSSERVHNCHDGPLTSSSSPSLFSLSSLVLLVISPPGIAMPTVGVCFAYITFFLNINPLIRQRLGSIEMRKREKAKLKKNNSEINIITTAVSVPLNLASSVNW